MQVSPWDTSSIPKENLKQLQHKDNEGMLAVCPVVAFGTSNVSLLYSAIDPKNNDLGNKKVKIVQPINSLPYCHIKGPVLVEGCILRGEGFEPPFFFIVFPLPCTNKDTPRKCSD